MSEFPNNPASRVLRLFEKTRGSSGSALSVWRAAFGLQPEPDKAETVRAILRRIVAVLDQIESVRAYALVQAEPERLWRGQLNELEKCLSLGNLAASFTQPGDRAIQSLEWFAYKMPDEAILDDLRDSLQDLLKELSDYRTAIEAAEIPHAVKLEVLRVLDDVRESLETIEVGGSRGFYRAASAAARMMDDLAPVIPDQPSTSAFKNWLDRLKPAAGLLASLARSGRDVAQMLEAGRTVLQIGAGEPPSPPTLE